MPNRKFQTFDSKSVWKKGVHHLRKNDRVLDKIIDDIGTIKIGPRSGDPYSALIRMFVYQQIAGSAAASILKKFEKLYGGRLPTPKEFLKTPEKKVRSAGISPQKYSYIKDLCERVTNKKLALETLETLDDDEVISILDEVRGIGRWTAEAFLMFNLRRVNVFPADDLGLMNAVKKAYRLKNRPDKKRLQELSIRWEPYKSIAAMYLWRSLDSAKEKSK